MRTSIFNLRHMRQWSAGVATVLLAACTPATTPATADSTSDSANPCGTAYCDDGNPCTIDSCSAETVCVHAAADSTPCVTTSPDCPTGVCHAGTCVATPSVVCGVGCQLGVCNGAGACVPGSGAATLGCSDGDPCTNDGCVGNSCSHSPVSCDDANVCTDDACSPAGCMNAPNAVFCDDGDACTEGDSCVNAKCGGFQLACNDEDTCTNDACSGGACSHTSASVCGDGKCNCGEDVNTCPADCKGCPTPGLAAGCSSAWGEICFARSAVGGGNLCVSPLPDPSWPNPFPASHGASDFVVQKDHTIDKLTGLSWAHEELASQDWSAALTACTDKAYGGYLNWRLPTAAELVSILDTSGQFAVSYAPGLVSSGDGIGFWTGLPTPTGGAQFVIGATKKSDNKAAKHPVRCVR